MASVCLYFQVHQPFRLRRYSFFDIGKSRDYFDEGLNRELMRRAADRCYLPANKAILRIIERTDGRFRAAFSVTGTALEQMRLYAPDALESFRALARTGAVEFLAETSHHSLASLHDEAEFLAQVERHRSEVEREFGQLPAAFRNTELLYSDAIGSLAARQGFKAILAEGSDELLGWRSAQAPFCAAGTGMPLLLRNYRLSDDIAFRFPFADGPGRSLTPESFVRRLQALPADSDTAGIFMDYETFGEHLGESTSVFAFLQGMPQAVLSLSAWDFKTPSELAARSVLREELRVPSVSSWADESRDASAWMGNEMQRSALARTYELGSRIRAAGNTELLETWRRLQASDHFYYMSTKGGPDGGVHSYFRPFDSPYEAFMAHTNVLKDLASRLA